MKSKVSLLSVTAFFVFYFAVPKVQACVSTNQFANHQAVPINQITNIVPEVSELTPTEAQDSKVLAPIIFFVIILIVFVWIIYQLIKILDRIIPPPEKQPDPPPNSGNTNYPPIVMNPGAGPGPVTSGLHTKSLTIDSNTPSWGPVQYYDIAWLHYENKNEKFLNRVDYDGYWSTGMTTTTNLVDWEDSHYRVDCFVCSVVGAVLYRYYHYDTNYWNCYYTTTYVGSNHMAPAWFDLSDGPPKPNQFFRLAPR